MSTEAAANSTGDASLCHEVTAADLPLHCPGDEAGLWSMHPRVYLPVAEQGAARCPYCGACYVFKGKAGH